MSAQPQINLEGGSQPTAEECQALIGRIAASHEFRRAKRLRAFLSYVVDRQLDGHSDEISEVLIGHRVFGRPVDYNPGDDSIVRTEARNLRQRLDRYYDGEGVAEPVRIEIPRGGYVPVFRLREPAVAAASPSSPLIALTRRRWIWMAAPASVAAVVAASRMVPGLRSPNSASAAGSTGTAQPGQVQFESSDARLTQAFQRAKERAMGCVYAGDRIGDWYASSPDSNAFCMRDLSHESLGASVLGLTRHTANMLRRFALSISRDRKWCGYWLITKDGFPSPQSYANDSDFGYCLPAGLDLVRACYRQFLWTGDRAYLDAAFSNFYERTVTSYVAAWDKDHTGFMKSNPERKRIHGSYLQGPRFQTGADLVAAQYAAWRAYAAIQEQMGAPGSLSARRSAEFRSQAEALRRRFNAEWWNPSQNRFYSGITPAGAFDAEYVDQPNVYGLWFGIPEEGEKSEASLDAMEQSRPKYDSNFSYYPEVLYRYGRNRSAYKFLLEIADPGFSGYGLTETAFAVVGAIASGLMGISPDAPHRTVATLPRLTSDTAWARLSHVPVMQNEVTVEHKGPTETILTNLAGTPLQWKPSFAGTSLARILVDGKPLASAVVQVAPGRTRTARLVL